MTREAAVAKVVKLRALAANPGAAEGEAEAARRRAEIIVNRYELTDTEIAEGEQAALAAQAPTSQPQPTSQPMPAQMPMWFGSPGTTVFGVGNATTFWIRFG